MGRQACCEKVGIKKGAWSGEEDKKLIAFILATGAGQCCWRSVPLLAGLSRCGKSCRLRWTNYLRPDLKRGLLSDFEENVVINLHAQLGNRWSKIASHLPGRTDNEIKNHWNTHIKKKLKKMGIDPSTHKPLRISTTSTAADRNHDPIAQAVDQGEIKISENNNSSDQDHDLHMFDDFCVDEVPVIQPNHDQLLLSFEDQDSAITPPGAAASSSSSSSSSYSQFSQTFDDYYSVWDDDFSSLNFLIDDESSLNWEDVDLAAVVQNSPANYAAMESDYLEKTE